MQQFEEEGKKGVEDMKEEWRSRIKERNKVTRKCVRGKRERWDQNQIRHLEFRNPDVIFIISDLKNPYIRYFANVIGCQTDLYYKSHKFGIFLIFELPDTILIPPYRF